MRRPLAWLALVVLALSALPGRAAAAAQVATLGPTYLPGDRALPVRTLYVPRGMDLRYTNLDVTGHSVTSFGRASNGTRLFDSGVLDLGRSEIVRGVANLPSGTYGFFCTLHGTGQAGDLVVF